mgnify:CR=1 FL=1
MKSELIIIWQYLLSACRYSGLTSYLVITTPTNKLVKKTTFSVCFNAIAPFLYASTLTITLKCSTRTNFHLVSAIITRVVYFAYLVFLYLVLNSTQTRVITTFKNIIKFENTTAKFIHKKINTSRVSKILKYAIGVRCLSIAFMYTTSISLVGLTSWEVMFCHLRFLFISLLFLSGESLIFFYLLACWNILKVFNFFIKEERNVEIKQIKEILHLYHGVKTDIQRISSLFVFFKLIHVAVELATTLYGLFREVETQEVDFLTKIHAFLVTGYWFFELTMETLLVLCPYMFLSEQVIVS